MEPKKHLNEKKIIFMGSPEFANPFLKILDQEMNVVLVVTQPDRPAGRGKQLTESPVKVLAQDLGIKVFQPKRLRKSENIEVLKNYQVDFIIVVAYGQILPAEILEIPQISCINVHASILPLWRGASPIQAAIRNGDKQTGLTIMNMDEGLDTGPILMQKRINISEYDTGESLSKKLSDMGPVILIETITAFLNNEIIPIPQDDNLATFAPLLKKEDGALDFNETAANLERKIRAYHPWPGTYMHYKNEQLKVYKAKVVHDISLTPGVHGKYFKYPIVGTSEGGLLLEQVQNPGKNPLDGKAFLNGARDWVSKE